MDRYSQIGLKIKKLREDRIKPVSQLALAQAIGKKSSTYIALIESGERKVRVDDLEKIAKFFDKNISFFLGNDAKTSDSSHVQNSYCEAIGRLANDLKPKQKKELLNFINFIKHKNG